MTAIQDGYRPEPSEPPIATVLGTVEKGHKSFLKRIQVKFGGREQEVWLAVDDVHNFGLLGPAGLEVFEKIHYHLERLVPKIGQLSGAIGAAAQSKKG